MPYTHTGVPVCPCVSFATVLQVLFFVMNPSFLNQTLLSLISTHLYVCKRLGGYANV